VDFGNVLTIGWFGDVFFVMSAQNSAIFANPISTIDVIGASACPTAAFSGF
jgi:hypothetical protein